MAAPIPASVASRVPSGNKLDRGCFILVTIGQVPQIKFWEKEVTPPGYDGGELINTSTMHNALLHTKAPQCLVDTTDMTILVAYDPAVWPEIRAAINRRDTITVHWPDGSTFAFFGCLRVFTPAGVNMEGQPEATVTISPLNTDEGGVEQDGVYTAAAPPPAPFGGDEEDDPQVQPMDDEAVVLQKELKMFQQWRRDQRRAKTMKPEAATQPPPSAPVREQTVPNHRKPGYCPTEESRQKALEKLRQERKEREQVEQPELEKKGLEQPEQESQVKEPEPEMIGAE